MTVTIRDVATRAGVAPITVSRAFSGTHPVASKTRKKIFEVAEELGYAPDLLARALVQKQTPIIGVTVLELANPFFTPIIDAIQAEAQKYDHMVIVSQSERNQGLENQSINQFRRIRVAGVIVTPASTDLTKLAGLAEFGTIAVVVTRTWADGHFVCVDDLLGGRIVGEHLAGLGHNQFGCIAFDEPSNTALQSRIAGFGETIDEQGGEFPAKWTIITETLSIEQGKQAADVFMDLTERPTAVFVTADHLAIGFIHRLRERGVRIPEELAVVGYDDIPYSEFLEIPLTTVALPKYEMGRKAAQILFHAISHKDESFIHQQVMLTPRLVVRTSCGAKQV